MPAGKKGVDMVNGRESAGLPVDEALPSLKDALRNRSSAVLVAPPGAGKTTRVPLALLEEPWAAGKRILMLEPRRLAARSAARYMAASLGEPVGQTVGYRVRMDTRVGPKTRIEVITEGVLTRMLQEDPELSGVAAVLFDEFHERSLHADLGLALCLQAQELLRDDLRLVVMSATLEAEPVAALMGEAPVVVSTGRTYPVETRYLPKRPEGRMEDRTAAAAVTALRENQGDILVFLPGAGEIRRTEERLSAQLAGGLAGPVRVLPLHGTLPQEVQDLALAPAQPGTRKVVLATSIAETSLTVDGVRVVVDAGFSRVARFSPRTGMTRLDTVPVSVASADQRRGRAGRQGPGICYRLWPEQDQGQLPARTAPEILEADLAPLCLDLAAWGAAPEELRWLDAPPAAALAQARALLQRLGALGADGAVTPHGRAMAGLGLHPRLAHMALKARQLGLQGLGCELAALLGERDVLRAAEGAAPNADLRLRVEALRNAGGEARSLGLRAAPAALARVRAEASWWMREPGSAQADTGCRTAASLAAGSSAGSPAAGSPAGSPTAGGPASPTPAAAPRPALSGPGADLAYCGLLLAFAYPDRIGQQRSRGRYLLSNGRGAVMAADQHLAGVPYLVAAELDDQGADSRIYLAAPVDLAHLETYLHEGLEEEEAVEWEETAQAVRAKKRLRLGALILKEKQLQNPPAPLVTRALLAAIAKDGLEALPWTKAARQLLQRLRFMQLADPSWPDVAEETLLAALPDWLGPYAEGMRSKQDLARVNLGEALTGLLDWNRRQELDRFAPTHLQVPSGSRIPVDYSDPGQPFIAVRLQELFGLIETPRIGGGRVPVVIHLLSPAQRPVQVTRDLAGFWRETYFDVKKDLKGRYPKHYWPENPLEAIPTNRVRPKPQG